VYALLGFAAMAACHRSTSTPAPGPRSVYTSGDQVVAAMRGRYNGKWYTTLTFTQKTSRLSANDTWSSQTWYEAMRSPGRLRIDFDPITNGDGVLYARDSEFVVQKGRLVSSKQGINPLLLLGFDIYNQTLSRSINQLKREGFDLSRFHEATFDGRPMLVIGARQGDARSKQFWIDAEHLYFVRLIEPAARDTTKRNDIRFLQYRREGDAWIAPRVEVHADGKLVFYEDYSDIKSNVPLDEALFDPAKWKTAKHWMVP
jgi:hypothetical protein